MNYQQATLLGIIQGLTEFLPVSSSAHLVIVQVFCGLREATENVTFDLMLHLATVVAVLWIYRKDLVAIFKGSEIGETDKIKGLKLLWLIALSLLATGIALPFKDIVEEQFGTVNGVRVFLLINAVALALIPQLRKGRSGLGKLRWYSAIFVGVAQAVAVLPGISRSGWTIMAGLLIGLSPREACRYSFLLSIPTMLAAAILQMFDALHEGFNISPVLAIAGFIMALASGIIAIPFLIGATEKGKLWGFAVYCAVLGMALFFVAPPG